MSDSKFSYQHRVQFYETDLMGIVHHGNYIRFYEEARVAWAHAFGLIDYNKPESASFFAVIETQVRHIKPLKFGDQVNIQVQARMHKATFEFEYKMFLQDVLVSEARTFHAALAKDLKPIRPPANMREIFAREQWTETWLLSL